ncbi:MAG: hypothetical protein WBY47_10645, partial [Desulfobacterales bacterium]
FRSRSLVRRSLQVKTEDGAEDQPTGILKYVEDLIRGLNADIGRKDFFEMASKILLTIAQKARFIQ